MKQIYGLTIITLLAAGCSRSPEHVATANQRPAATSSDLTAAETASAKPASEVHASEAVSETSQPLTDTIAAEAEAAPKQVESRAAANGKEPIAVTFEDLNLNMQADIVYRPVMMTDRVRELEGKLIKLKGFMLSGLRQKGIKEFILVKNTECKFGKGGQADHLAEIKLQGTATARFTNRPVEVEGVLRIEPYQGTDGNTWSIFQIEATSVRPG